jgi:hypothetical protein
VNGHELGEALYVPTNFYRPALAASIVVPGHILVYGFTVYNSNAAAQYVLMFDANELPANGLVPILAQNAATKQLSGVSWTPQGREFLEGFVLCNSSTDTTKTIGAADCFFDVQYDVLG